MTPPKTTRPWQPDEEAYILESYLIRHVAEISKKLNRTPNSVYQKYNQLFKGHDGQELKARLELDRKVNFDPVNQTKGIKGPGSGWRFLNEGEQREIAEAVLQTSLTGAANRYHISKRRTQLILEKFGYEVPNRAQEQEERRAARESDPASLNALKKMVGKRYFYFAKKRTIQGYELVEVEGQKEVHIRTVLECAKPYERVVKLPLRGISGMLRDWFIPA